MFVCFSTQREKRKVRGIRRLMSYERFLDLNALVVTVTTEMAKGLTIYTHKRVSYYDVFNVYVCMVTF